MMFDINHRRLATSNKDIWPDLPSPHISVILTSHNNSHELLHVLHSWSAGQDLPFEILVADDGSSDDTLSICRQRWPFECRYIWKPNRGFHMSKMLNLGIRLAQSDNIFISDTGCLAFPGLLAEHLKHLKPGILVGGNCTQCDDTTILDYPPEQMAIRGILQSILTTSCLRHDPRESRHVPLTEITHTDITANTLCISTTTNISFHRSGWYDLGGYDETYTHYGFQDYEFGYRWFASGRTGLFAPQARNINIGYGERKLVHPDNAHRFEALTGWRLPTEIVSAA